ncbi:MAG: PTS sugar transporter subunit IIA [Verrucomicrobiae bacterium]|nr:PTS sugar transporter subunit IIA [Verrucomicrobiae bacterium]NNJ42226.1 PTS sugar transporter subunit IIA [Akkermansiaceae bacterium]
MKLASLLTPEQIILDLQGEVCEEATSAIVDHLIAKGLLDGELREDILESLREREQQISTGIGSGVAIPHAFSDSVEQVVAAFGRSKDGVDFEALDNAPVNFVILFIVPKKEYNLHLQTLAAIARMFNNCEVRQQLQGAQTIEEVLDIFASRPSRIHSEK